MPATAGRVRMPANNRVHSSAALQTHGIWQSAIGYDPYAPNKNDSKQSGQQVGGAKALDSSEPEGENAYASFQGLLALARITGSNADEARGSCKKCGRVGHLTFQCRNFLSIKDDDKEKDKDSVALHTIRAPLDKSKANGAARKATEESSEESSEADDESDSSDSDVDSEIERIIAVRYGKKGDSMVKSSAAANKKRVLEDDGSGYGQRRKRRSSKKRRSAKRADNSDERDGKRRRRHGYSDDEVDGHRHQKKSKKEKNSNSEHSEDEDDENRRHRNRSHRKSKEKRSRHEYSDDDEQRHHRKSKKEKRSRR